jgi:hypothetical protein
MMADNVHVVPDALFPRTTRFYRALLYRYTTKTLKLAAENYASVLTGLEHERKWSPQFFFYHCASCGKLLTISSL